MYIYYLECVFCAQRSSTFQKYRDFRGVGLAGVTISDW